MNVREILTTHPLLEHLPPEQLDWLAEKSERLTLPEGEFLFKPGDTPHLLYLILSGRLQIYVLQNGQKREIALHEPFSITGKLPYSRMQETIAYGLSLATMQILCLSDEHFPEMIAHHYELTEVLVHQMTNRVRENIRQQQQNEKMISLGKLSAGLAHELNNPAAALVRSAAVLKAHLSLTPERFGQVMAMQMSGEQIEGTVRHFAELTQENHQPLTLLQRNDLENDLMDWLDDRSVPESTELAPQLVDFGFSVERLEQINATVGEVSLAPVLQWLINNLSTERMVSEIEEASQRISHLIGSVKSYSHMDRANVMEKTRLAEGIRSTLTLLGHKIREKNIKVSLDLSPDLPLVNALAGELNQVWTNLIDNAVDAMPPGGTLTIRSHPDREFVVTDIADNGSGIPPEIVGQIFDPFFTTKDIGKGTGLGLDIVRKIIANHNGSIKVKSEPGETVFSVCLPV
jgi:signal transduction histidine kinase